MKHCFSTVWHAGWVAALAPSWSSVHAEALMDDLTAEQQKWDHIQYELPAEQREDAFKGLAVTAASILAKHPDRAEAYTWPGITLAYQAWANGGIGALCRSHARRVTRSTRPSLSIPSSWARGLLRSGQPVCQRVALADRLWQQRACWRNILAGRGCGAKRLGQQLLLRRLSSGAKTCERSAFIPGTRAASAHTAWTRPVTDRSRRAKVEMLLKSLPVN